MRSKDVMLGKRVQGHDNKKFIAGLMEAELLWLGCEMTSTGHV